MKTVVYKMEPFSCPTCAEVIEKVLMKQKGINTVKVQFFSNKVKVSFDSERISSEQIHQVLTKLGYSVLESKQAS